LTGETYRYSKRKGRFRSIKPSSEYGAVEFAARYGTIDLDDKAIAGGLQRDVTVGVNWYINRNVRLGANYIWARATPSYRGINESLSAVLVRAQLKL
jgi:phosphate-selective porin OprO/OprP